MMRLLLCQLLAQLVDTFFPISNLFDSFNCLFEVYSVHLSRVSFVTTVKERGKPSNGSLSAHQTISDKESLHLPLNSK